MSNDENHTTKQDAGRKLLLSAGLLGLLASAVGTGTWAYYSATATSGANTFAAGTVSITEDDTDDVMFAMSGLKPGDTSTKCILVTYTGSLSSNVRLYSDVTEDDTLAPYLDITVARDDSSAAEPGVTNDCTDFVADSTPISTRKLSTFATSWATATGAYDLGTWAQNATAVFRFTVAIPAEETAGAGATASVTFTWEARAGT
jgi:predicted ribosomally synthesized peptide with SipW-like signal peptide